MVLAGPPYYIFVIPQPFCKNLKTMNEHDTDMLIAIVSSLLASNGETRSPGVILDALIVADGDADVAVRALLSKPSQIYTKAAAPKRKHGDLNSWLQSSPKHFKASNEEAKAVAHSTSHSTGGQSSSSSSNPVKPSSDLMSLLQRHTSDPKKKPPKPRLPPLVLATPEMVAKHTPCSLHLSILPAELACQLFYRMIDVSKTWKKNKWWLFDRVVESPHLTSFFARKTDGLSDDETWQEAAQFWYNGRPTDPPEMFSKEMEEACKIVEDVVNQEMNKRSRTYKLEWRGGATNGQTSWRANVAASNCYRGGKESVGFHSDQLTYLGPYPTIASLSLGTRRNFSLREVIPTDEIGTRTAQTFHIPLPHNSLTIMHASCQEKFKHSIPPQTAIDLFRPPFPPQDGVDCTMEASNCRINITFRFYRPDFRPSSIPRCRCGVPTILRPDMKNRTDGETDRYFWTCYSGAQNEGKGCNFWKLLDMKEEGRGSSPLLLPESPPEPKPTR